MAAYGSPADAGTAWATGGAPGSEPRNRLAVLEMKGKHLAGNDDTEYKKAVLKLMSDAYAIEPAAHVGELELVAEDGTRVECELVLMPDWKTRLPQFFG
ncbi:MAG: hypothetical protein JNL98_44520 [Bryobacterales bacterium]|nr:hypothetical protein [Bryobacterales bacterium]